MKKLETIHKEEHFMSSAFVKDVVIGMADGLTVPFALAAGLSNAVSSNSIIITAGIAEMVAGAIAMGLGGYLAANTEKEHYYSELKREYEEVEQVPEEEKKEVMGVFAKYGVGEELQWRVAEELSQDKDNWVDFMMRYELGLDKPDPKRAQRSAITIGSAYFIGGIVPLFAYFVTAGPMQGLKWSAITTIAFLFVFGYVKTKKMGQAPLKGALHTVIIGIAAATAAYFIARFVS